MITKVVLSQKNLIQPHPKDNFNELVLLNFFYRKKFKNQILNLILISVYKSRMIIFLQFGLQYFEIQQITTMNSRYLLIQFKI